MVNPIDVKLNSCRICPLCDDRIDDAEISFCPTDGTALVDAQVDSLFGTVLVNRYLIGTVIGTGGWGTVYRATHTALNKTVAVKMLHRHMVGDAEKVKRFEQEARAVGSVTHENIAAVHDYGSSAAGQPFLVLEYLHGTSLQSVLDTHQLLDPGRALNIYLQICSGLVAAHDQGIIHRDIKPSNVFLTAEGDREVAKLLDFGLAKLMQDEGRSINPLTRAGETLGTPPYMSPEQCTGGLIDQRSDIYSFGCLMYEALTGIQPFGGQSAFQCMTRHISESAPPFSNASPSNHLLVDLESVVFKSLAKEPVKRYQSTKELQSALLAVQQRSQDSRLRASERLQRALRMVHHTARSQTKLVSITAVLLGLCLISAVVFIYRSVQTDPARLPLAERWFYFVDRAQSEMLKGQYPIAEQDFTRALSTAETFPAVQNKLLCLQYLALLHRTTGEQSKEVAVDNLLDRLSLPSDEVTSVRKTSRYQKTVFSAILEKLQRANGPVNYRDLTLMVDQINEMPTDWHISDAEEQLKQAQAVLRKNHGENTKYYALVLDHLAEARYTQNDLVGALDLFLTAEKILAESEPAGFNLIRIRVKVGDMYYKLKNAAAAQKYLEKGVAQGLHSKEFSLEDRILALHDLASVLQSQNKYRESYDVWDELIQQFLDQRQFTKIDFDCLQMVYAGYRAGIRQLVENNLTTKKEALEKQYGFRNDGVASCLMALAEHAFLYHDLKRAQSLSEQSVRIRLSVLLPDSENLRRSLDQLQRIYLAQHEYDKATSVNKELLACAQRYMVTDKNVGWQLAPLMQLSYLSTKKGDLVLAKKYADQYRRVLSSTLGRASGSDFTAGLNCQFSELHGAGMTPPEFKYLTIMIKKQQRVGVLSTPCPQSLDALSRLAAEAGDCSAAADYERSAIEQTRTGITSPFVEAGIYAHYESMLRKLGRSKEADTLVQEAVKFPKEGS